MDEEPRDTKLRPKEFTSASGLSAVTSPSRPTILLADDHAILLDAFKRLLEPAYAVVGAVTDGRALVEAALRLKPDVIVADISMPQLNGLDACERLCEALPDTRLIFLTANEDPDVAAEAVRRGAAGYLLKKAAAAELFTALRHVLEGRYFISPRVSSEPPTAFVEQALSGSRGQRLTLRQREVLQLLAEGRSMKEAASVLKLAPRTIAFHKYTMMRQLGFKTGAELVAHAVQLGLVGLGSGSTRGRRPTFRSATL
jgi:DNA-binding NarL/FixJ family response regulator